MAASKVWVHLPLAAFLLAAPSRAQVTQLVTVSTSGTQANQFINSVPGPILSADGKLAVFVHGATNLVAGDTNGVADVFVRDLASGTTRRVNVDSSGAQANGLSSRASISANGRWIAFDSDASNLVPGDTNGARDAFVHDLETGATTRVSVSTAGVQGSGQNPSISADGRYVSFEGPNHLVGGWTNTHPNILVRDRQLGTTTRVGVGPGGVQANSACYNASISANGRYVAFLSEASNLVAGDTNPNEDVFVHDRVTGATERVNIAPDGSQGNNYLDIQNGPATPALSADGRFVAFISNASNLVAGDTNGALDVFVRDLQLGVTERANVGWNGGQAQGAFTDGWMSADGRFVAFTDSAPLAPGDANGNYDVFLRDRLLGTTELVSVATNGTQGDADSWAPSVSADGRCVVFHSGATNLVVGDANATYDLFVRQRATNGFSILCEPGVAGVIACPCSNPPDGPGRGCDNHGSATGGASLVGSGNASLASDSVVLSAGGENNSALTIVWTGQNLISPPAAVHGAGVRCVSGLHRLYSGNATGGFLSRPAMGDPSVSARSAAVGAAITAGQTRYYFTVYRDPLAAVPCGNAATVINLSNTVSAQWAP